MTAQRIPGAFGMSDTVWARHANPWSVWTRLPILPLWTCPVLVPPRVLV